MKVLRYKFIGILVCLLGILPCMTSCEVQDDFSYTTSVSPDDPLYDGNAWNYIEANAQEGNFKMLREAILLTGTKDLYEQKDSRTFILPMDIAFNKYLKNQNKTSLTEVDVVTLTQILKYNIAKGEYNTSYPSYFENNTLFEFETETGQPIYFSHDSSYRISINKGTKMSASVYLSNIVPTNGIIHITKVLLEYKPL